VTNHWIPAFAGITDTYTQSSFPRRQVAGAGMTVTYTQSSFPRRQVAGAGMTVTYTQSSFPRRRESIATTHTYWELTKM